MSRANEPLFPTIGTPSGEMRMRIGGITIREHFAGLALQGLMASGKAPRADGVSGEDWRARWAVKHADALIAELAKTVETPLDERGNAVSP